MLKTCKSLIFILMLLVCPMLFSACEIEAVESISMSNTEMQTYAIGDFAFSDYKVNVEYSTDKSEEVELSKDMISDDDYLKLYQEGTHSIDVNYKGKTCSFDVKIIRKTFDNISLNDIDVVYSGNPVVAQLEGDIPEGAEITYLTANEFTNFGEYEVKINISCENYEDKTFTSKVTIRKASYDMQNVSFENKTVVYDGNEHFINALNIPNGVSVKYYIEGEEAFFAKDAGSYEIVAKFTGDMKNYEIIPDMTAVLNIQKANYDLSGILFESIEKTYDGIEVETKLSDESLLPSGVSVKYENNKHIDAGTYTAVAKFSIPDSKNFNIIADMTTSIIINKANYDLSDILFLDDIVDYNGSSHALAINGNLPNGVSVEYLNNNQTNAGIYTVTAKFSHSNKNYNVISDMKATLEISKITASLSGVSIDASIEYNFSGDESIFYPSGLVEDMIEVDFISFHLVGTSEQTSDEILNSEGFSIFDSCYNEDDNANISTAGWYVIIVTFKDQVNYKQPTSLRGLVKINIA